MLVDELGIEPGPALQELEKAILRHDPELDVPDRPVRDKALSLRGTIVVVADDADRLDELLPIAEPLAREPPRELILARLLSEQSAVEAATAELAGSRSALAERGVASRVAAYTTTEPGSEAVLLATQYDADLLLVAALREVLDERSLRR